MSKLRFPEIESAKTRSRMHAITKLLRFKVKGRVEKQDFSKKVVKCPDRFGSSVNLLYPYSSSENVRTVIDYFDAMVDFGQQLCANKNTVRNNNNNNNIKQWVRNQ
jgi:hypothetical protein